MQTDICFLIRKMDNRVLRYFHSLYSRKAMDECSMSNMWVASFLYENADRELFQKDIEAHFGFNRATASKMLKLMEEKALIERVQSASDSRMKRLSLRPRGLALNRVCQSLKEEMDDKLASALTPLEQAEFRRLSEKIISHLEGDMDENG